MPMITTRKQRKVTWWDRVEAAYHFVVPYDLRPHQLWILFRDVTWKRFSTIKPRTLGHGWVERNDLLAHMSFEILGRFLEEECSPGHTLWYGEEGPKVGDEYALDIMDEVWTWWNDVYLRDYPRKDEALWEATLEYTPEIFAKEIGEGVRSSIFTFKSEDQEFRYRALTQESRDLNEEMERQIDHNLRRLISVRQHMWT